MRTSRNDPCPCGSGLKYKRCHEAKDLAKPRSSGILPLVLFLLLVAAGGAAVVIGIARGGAGSSSGKRVWSEEHKHWHNAAPARSEGSGPPGTAPPGKMWSDEHSHWHDAPGAGQPTPLPYDPSSPAVTGPSPPGWIWEPEHQHSHPPVSANLMSRITVVPRPTLATPAPQPAGTPPPGKVWSPEHGHWHAVSRLVAPPVAITATPP
jgi:SEC-C motif